MQALILAAGIGSRLGHDLPKALIPWGDGCIIDHQLDRLEQAGITDVWVVVGFEADRVQAHVGDRPGVRFLVSERYNDTNTSKSMLLGLQHMPAGAVVTLNGDVVFDDGIVQSLTAEKEASSLAVDPKVCGAEEVKYKVRNGRLLELSKQVHGDGEAVGINHFCAHDRPILEQALEYVDDFAFFERAVEHMLPFTQHPVRCIDIGDKRAMEIDFPEDLEEARRIFHA